MKHSEHIVTLLPPDAILGSKCTQNAFVGAPDPAEGAYSAPPDPLAVFGGPLRGREGEGKGGGKGEGTGRREGKEKVGREGKWTLATLRTDRRPWLITTLVVLIYG